MFPFQSGELSFQVGNNLDNNTNIITTNLDTNTTNNHHLFQEPYNEHLGLNTNLKSHTSRKRKSKISAHLNANYTNNEDANKGSDIIAQKKIIHREVERQRRQEMSTLHSSLRSLLPTDYIRGKRSICDHVTEAANYIKDLEKNVKELGVKRDKLKESFSSLENQPIMNKDNNNNFGCSTSSSTTSTSRNSNSFSEYNVSIHKFSRTLQIEISTRVGDEDSYPLSKTLKVLAEGLDVVSCVSSVVNQRWIYVIYCEVNDAASIDSGYLRDKLMCKVFSSDYS